MFDEIIDGLEGGRKLRKWYGSDSSVGDGAREARSPVEDVVEDDVAEDEDVELDLPRRSVLVTDADGALGEAVVVRLVLAKASIVACVSDKSRLSAEARFGPYARLASASWSAGARLNGVRAVVVTDALEDGFAEACARRGVKHVVLVSSAKSASGGLFADANARTRRDRKREEALARSGLAVTVVRPVNVRAEPGGAREIVFGQGDTMSGDISLEDLAETCARALTRPPKPGKVLTFEVKNGANARANRDDWSALFAPLSV